jgi:hypothetical protein
MVTGMAGTPQYSLFSCQVGLSVGACYDPYQMRRAYQVDGLIAQAFDGTGQTIVIVDAFQNPNLVNQIAFFNAFYGLPPTALTQIAPDGLTPFDPSDANMVGWAEEISLDVEWAHAIAPGARIVHLEFPGIDTGFYRFGGTSAGAPQGQYPVQDRRVVADVGNRALLAARQCRFLVGRSFISHRRC